MEAIKRTKHDIYPFISATGRLAGAAQGKTILITGGGKGIGKAIASQFALAGAAHIIITSRTLDALHSTKTEIETHSPTCTVTPITGDLVSSAAVAAVFAALPSTPPDIVINNAGTNLDATPVASSDPTLWWRNWEVNLKATYLVTRAYLHALHGSPGVIINVSSSVADAVAPTMSSYGTSKTAVNRFTEHVQLEYGAQGIRCVAFHPGGIASTGMGQTAPEQFRGNLRDTVELAAGTALYLSTAEAGYLDGRFVFANWDMELVEGVKGRIVQEDLLVSRIRYGTTFSSQIER